ncbi:hypothetical protein BU17DRAFT_63545 [Hysterangium stoloniferum]|nr:hypothetical protein BU17DRAFT_63545 [Hysterangium stoloniferum]
MAHYTQRRRQSGDNTNGSDNTTSTPTLRSPYLLNIFHTNEAYASYSPSDLNSQPIPATTTTETSSDNPSISPPLPTNTNPIWPGTQHYKINFFLWNIVSPPRGQLPPGTNSTIQITTTMVATMPASTIRVKTIDLPATIAPTAALLTLMAIGGLFMLYHRARRNHKASETPFTSGPRNAMTKQQHYGEATLRNSRNGYNTTVPLMRANPDREVPPTPNSMPATPNMGTWSNPFASPSDPPPPREYIDPFSGARIPTSHAQASDDADDSDVEATITETSGCPILRTFEGCPPGR